MLRNRRASPSSNRSALYGALGVPGFRDGKGRHGIGLHWFAAPELTLARPKAPHIAERALSASAGEQVHRPAPIAMRPLRQKSSRILSRGALEVSQLISCRRRSNFPQKAAENSPIFMIRVLPE